MSVPSRVIAVYDQPHQFEPLLPQHNLGGLVDLTRTVLEKSYRLQNAVAPHTRASLGRLVRAMNSYYSNQIEGQATHPHNIERAMHADFSKAPEVAKRQRIARAHIDAEQELEAGLPTANVEAHVLQSAFLLRAHDALYRRLEVADRTTDDGRVIEPGRLRKEDVAVG